jgi:hypothetical protein
MWEVGFLDVSSEHEETWEKPFHALSKFCVIARA